VRLWCAGGIGARVAAFPEWPNCAATSADGGGDTLVIARLLPSFTRGRAYDVSALGYIFSMHVQKKKSLYETT
jgi:hypothetical protein